jgi:hypothetical protein
MHNIWIYSNFCKLLFSHMHLQPLSKGQGVFLQMFEENNVHLPSMSNSSTHSILCSFNFMARLSIIPLLVPINMNAPPTLGLHYLPTQITSLNVHVNKCINSKQMLETSILMDRSPNFLVIDL